MSGRILHNRPWSPLPTAIAPVIQVDGLLDALLEHFAAKPDPVVISRLRQQVPKGAKFGPKRRFGFSYTAAEPVLPPEGDRVRRNNVVYKARSLPLAKQYNKPGKRAEITTVKRFKRWSENRDGADFVIVHKGGKGGRAVPSDDEPKTFVFEVVAPGVGKIADGNGRLRFPSMEEAQRAIREAGVKDCRVRKVR